MFRLDRTAFSINTFEEADNNTKYWLGQPVADRLRAAEFLTRQAYNIPPTAPLRLNRGESGVRTYTMAANIFNQDFQDLIEAFNQAKVEYMLVGGYAVIVHGYNRPTGDLDLWVNPTEENYERLVNAFATFGMPLFDMSLQKFLTTDAYDVFSFGVPPVAIDLITKLKGPGFADAFANSSVYEFEDVQLRVIQYGDLIDAKRAAGRLRDLNDVEQLEKGRR